MLDLSNYMNTGCFWLFLCVYVELSVLEIIYYMMINSVISCSELQVSLFWTFSISVTVTINSH